MFLSTAIDDLYFKLGKVICAVNGLPFFYISIFLYPQHTIFPGTCCYTLNFTCLF